MYKPKFSVILSTYLIPQDRFTNYGKVQKSAVELIELCASQGVFHGVELGMGNDPHSINKRNMREIKTVLDHHGLNLAGIVADTFSTEFAKGSLGASDPRVRQKAMDHVRQTMDVASELGCEYVGQWPGQDGWDFYFEVDYQRVYALWVEGMRQLADHNPNIKLGIEPKPYEPRAFSLLNSSAKVLLMIKDIDRSNVGLTLDIGHAAYGHESLSETVALAQMDRRLFHMHMNDNYGDMDWDMPFGSVHLQGFIELMYWLMRTDYQGYLSVDIFAYRTDPAETVLEGIKWMQAIFDLIQTSGTAALDALIEKGDGLKSQQYLRELIFGHQRK